MAFKDFDIDFSDPELDFAFSDDDEKATVEFDSGKLLKRKDSHSIFENVERLHRLFVLLIWAFTGGASWDELEPYSANFIDHLSRFVLLDNDDLTKLNTAGANLVNNNRRFISEFVLEILLCVLSLQFEVKPPEHAIGLARTLIELKNDQIDMNEGREMLASFSDMIFSDQVLAYYYGRRFDENFFPVFNEDQLTKIYSDILRPFFQKRFNLTSVLMKSEFSTEIVNDYAKFNENKLANDILELYFDNRKNKRDFVGGYVKKHRLNGTIEWSQVSDKLWSEKGKFAPAALLEIFPFKEFIESDGFMKNLGVFSAEKKKVKSTNSSQKINSGWL